MNDVKSYIIKFVIFTTIIHIGVGNLLIHAQMAERRCAFFSLSSGNIAFAAVSPFPCNTELLF